MKKTLDYIPGVVAFLAMGMGVSVAPKWDPTQKGLRHLTQFGWTTVTVGLGVAALVASLLLTWYRQRDLDLQTRQRECLQAIAHAEIRLALREIMWPFFSLFAVNAPDMSDCWGFGEFWKTMRNLDALLGKEPDRLRRRL